MGILVGKGNTRPLSVRHLLSYYGKPDQVFIWTLARTIDRSHPFALIISYASKQFIANYDIEANQVGDYLVACPTRTAPWIYIHAPQLPWSTTEIQDQIIGPDPPRPMLAIDQASALSVASFHDLFSASGEAACIWTPAALW